LTFCRLVSEQRVAGIDTLETTIAFLPIYIADHIRRFTPPPATAPRGV